MDELDLLTRHRPDPAPPTAAERDGARAALMAHVAADGRPVVDLAAPPRRTRRTLRRAVALAGVAAAVVTGLLVAGGSDRAPEQLRDRPATAAEQLAAIADVVAPYPALPYGVEVRSVQSWSGGETRTSEGLVHHALPEVWITEVPGCAHPCRVALAEGGLEALPFAVDADAAAVRAGIEDTVRARAGGLEGVVEAWDEESVAQFRVYLLSALLQHPAVGPTARAEMLRMLAEVPGLTATPGERSAFGAEGTLFRFVQSGGEVTMVLIDPSDGYVLELRRTAPPFDPADVPEETEGIELVPPSEGQRGAFSLVTTYARPVDGPLPDAVAALAADVAEKAPAVDGGVTIPANVPVCIGGIGPMVAGEDGDVVGVSVPDGLAYTYCGQP